MEWYAKRKIGELADEIALRYPSREGLVFEGDRYTFSEVASQVDLAATALMAHGIRPGEHVALWLNNCAEWIFVSLALAKIGAVQVPINTRFRTRDFAYVLRQSDSVAVITHATSGPIDYLGMVREVVALPTTGEIVDDPNFPLLRKVIIVSDTMHDGTVSWAAAKVGAENHDCGALQARAAAVDPDGSAFIMYTSGTTGHPKGVVHSHKILRNIEERGFRMGITPRDTILNYLPLFHAFGFSEGMMMSLLTGARHVVTATFDPDECLDLIEREQVTIVHGFEAHLKALTDAQAAHPRDISSLRTGIFAAGMMSATPVLRRGMQVMAPLRPISGFGMTEVWLGAGIGALDDDDPHRAEGSGFPALGYEIRIVNPDTGEEAPVGVAGELCARGYSLMLGYYKNAEATAACYDADGWFHTGDTAIWLEDGSFRFLGRYKDMLKVGGENVDPMETEGLLLEHPDVHDVAVVGLPDDRLSEVAVAFVQLVPGSTAKEGDIIAACEGEVASFKVPRHVLFVDAMPMTASGKIRKVELREIAKRQLRPDMT